MRWFAEGSVLLLPRVPNSDHGARARYDGSPRDRLTPKEQIWETI